MDAAFWLLLALGAWLGWLIVVPLAQGFWDGVREGVREARRAHEEDT